MILDIEGSLSSLDSSQCSCTVSDFIQHLRLPFLIQTVCYSCLLPATVTVKERCVHDMYFFNRLGRLMDEYVVYLYMQMYMQNMLTV